MRNFRTKKSVGRKFKLKMFASIMQINGVSHVYKTSLEPFKVIPFSIIKADVLLLYKVLFNKFISNLNGGS